MGGINLKAQTRNFVEIANGSRTQTSTANTAADVAGSKVLLAPGECADGLVLRWTTCGTKTGGNAVFTLKLYLDSTLLSTLTSDAAASEADWMASFVLYCAGGATEKIAGVLTQETEAANATYDAGSTSLQNGGTLKLVVTSGNASDTITTEFCVVERFMIP